jgi:hypothetical protein
MYELAYQLGITYTHLLSLPYEEIQGWFDYFSRRPLGWREDQRVSLMLMAQGVEKKPHEIFSSLRTLAVAQEEEDNRNVNDPKAMSAKLVKSGFLARLQAAAANNDVEWKLNDKDGGGEMVESID